MALRIIFLFVFVGFCTMISPNPAKTAGGGEGTYTVEDINWQKDQNAWIYKVKGGSIPTYTRYELFSPHRLRLDIADGAIAEHFNLPLNPEEGPVSMIGGKTVDDKEVEIYRLELLVKNDAEFKVRDKGNDILVRVSRPQQEKAEKGKKAAEENGKSIISDISMQTEPEGLLVGVEAGAPIYACEATEVAGSSKNPPQLILELDSVGTEKLVRKGSENSLVSVIRAEPYMNGSRVRLDSSTDEMFDYDLLTSENGLLVKIRPPESDTDKLLAAITDGALSKKKVADRPPREIAPRIKKTRQEEVRKRRKEPEHACSGDQFSSAGYAGEKITVDFYQSNLHNVFRLIGEVSGRNIIVAEGVGGTLTLSLKDVPWDFMLDIILNLKNLNKEEQFNTIIISPASKKFEWPGQDEKEDLVVNRPAVSQETMETRGRMEAAKLLHRAKGAEKTGNLQEALSLYEKVFNLDSGRGDIAARITSLALSTLNLNAKAAHYGRIAVRLKPEDKHLALLTATALAKTGKPREAVRYYEQAVSGPHPSAQALAAYAAFSEEYKSYQMALELWNRYEEYYGTSLETMVNRARISDILGHRDKAAEIYRRITMSGYKIPSDLSDYINHRLKD